MPAFDPIAFDSNAFDTGLANTGTLPSGLVLGFDPFDALLNQSCAILENQTPIDAYGQRSGQAQNFTTIATVPCLVSTDAPGRPHEFKVEKGSSLDYARVFMRVPILPGGAEVSTRHWLLIDGDFYNVFNVLNPGGLSHHLELICEITTP